LNCTSYRTALKYLPLHSSLAWIPCVWVCVLCE
jgi:hypothetical protein